jgi:hypothetical protein
MAMIRVEPVNVRVRADWFDGRPRHVSWGGDQLRVTRVAAVRHEDAAYRADVGPRTVFEVETPQATLALSFEHWTRRWTVEGVDEQSN